MKILIVGGYGCVGSMVAHHLTDMSKQNEIDILDSDIFGTADNTKVHFAKNVSCFDSSLANYTQIEKIKNTKYDLILFSCGIDVEEYYSSIFEKSILANHQAMIEIISDNPTARIIYLTQQDSMSGASYSDYINKYIKPLGIERVQVPDLYGSESMVFRNDTFINGILYDFLVYKRSAVELHPFSVVKFAEVSTWCKQFTEYFVDSSKLDKLVNDSLSSINLAHAVHWSLEGNEEYELGIAQGNATLIPVQSTTIQFTNIDGFTYSLNLTIKAVSKGLNPSFMDISNNRKNVIINLLGAKRAYEAMLL